MSLPCKGKTGFCQAAAAASARMGPRAADFVAIDADAHDEWGGARCFNEALAHAIVWDAVACARTRGPGRRVLLWGDSMAAHYTPGIVRMAAGRGATVLEYTFAGCPPILAFTSVSRPGCMVSNAAVPDLVRRQHIDTVVMAALWTDAPLHTLLRLNETVARLQAEGVRVIVIGQSPAFAADPQRIDYLSGQTLAPVGRWRISFDPAINNLLAGQAHGARFIDPLAALCAGGTTCPYRIGRAWLYGDSHHFSIAGSTLAAERYFPLDGAAAAS